MSSKRELVLEAVINVVAQVGLASFSMAQIIEKAEVGAGTVYRYFPGKDILLQDAYEELEAQQIAAFVSGIDPKNRWPDQLESAVCALLQYLVTHPERAGFLEQYAVSPKAPKVKDEKTLEIWAVVIEFLASGLIQGYRLPLGIHGSIAALFGMVGGVAHEVRHGGLAFGDELAAKVARRARLALCEANSRSPTTKT